MPEELKSILDFVEGRIDARRFESLLHANLTGFEELLSQDPNLTAQNYASPNVYLFVLWQDFSDPGCVLSIHGALAQYLERNGVAFRPTDVYGDFYDLLLKAQPGWLDIDSKYLAKMVEQSGGLGGEVLRQWLHTKLLKRFRYLDAPPVWIQSPEWPINDNGPLFFLCQMDVLEYFHDAATAYVFHDRKDGYCETVIQVY